MILTSNTEATDQVQFLNFAYTVKGFQCHNNNSLQLLELKEKTTTKQYMWGGRYHGRQLWVAARHSPAQHSHQRQETVKSSQLTRTLW